MAESDHTSTSTQAAASTSESVTSRLGALLLNRAELFLLEAGAAKQQLWGSVILTALGVLAAFMTMLFALILIILVAPEAWRVWLLGGITIFFLLFAWVAFWLVRRSLQQAWFESSMNAVKEDWHTLSDQPATVAQHLQDSQESRHE